MIQLGYALLYAMVLGIGANAFIPPAGGVRRSFLTTISEKRGSPAPYRSSRTGIQMKLNIGQGSYAALVTPFKTGGGEVDEEALRGLLRWHLESGTDGIVSLGTTGEASVLSFEERGRVLEITVQEVGGKIPIVAGTSSVNPWVVVDQTKQAAEIGCDAVLVVTPAYVKPPQEGLIEFYKLVADKGALPVVLYNVPGRTAVDLKTETVAHLAQYPGIVGLKEATGDLSRLGPLRDQCPQGFLLYSGDDATGMDFVLQGGDGVVSVTTNVVPQEMSLLMKASLRGDRNEAESINNKVKELHDALFVQANPIPVKYALSRVGRLSNVMRVPLVPLHNDLERTVDGALTSSGCL